MSCAPPTIWFHDIFQTDGTTPTVKPKPTLFAASHIVLRRGAIRASR